MATLILKSLGIGYAITLIGMVIMTWSESEGELLLYMLIMPILFWHVTLVVSALVFLVFKAIDESKKKSN